jgi:hypothetical protein
MASLLSVNTIAAVGSSISISGGDLYVPGHVLQFVNTTYTTPTSVSIPASYNTYTDVTGVAVTITPKSVNSKIYIRARWTGELNPTADMSWQSVFGIKRNGTLIGLPPQLGSSTIGIHMPSISHYASDNDSTSEHGFFDCWDAPASTSALTYQLTFTSTTGGTMYINRCVNGTTSGGYERGTSSITVMEIAN